ncbi:hypothetical protein COCNU_scaffold016239G000130 [Cocos nucifera]|nr:hypothetical protein [Cocos nucifera]
MAPMVFESHNGGDVIFFVIILWLSIISMIIFASVDDASRPRKRSKTPRGPASIGGKGCACGDSSTYLSC